MIDVNMVFGIVGAMGKDVTRFSTYAEARRIQWM